MREDRPSPHPEPPASRQIEEIAESVADQTPVDWNPPASWTPDDRRRFENLRRVDRISAAYRESARSYQSTEGSAADDAASLEGSSGVWGPLQVRGLLGWGSQADVFLAYDPRLRREVALKLEEHAGPERPRRQLLEEGRRLARLRHPNVLTVYGADEHDGRVGIWAERVVGRTLEEVLRDRGPLSATASARVGIQLCGALAAIHGAGLLHGDVKASNVMLRRDSDRVVLIDLGSGRDRHERRTPSGPRSPSGTPLVLAPEDLAGGTPGVGTDVYALGVLLYRLVTGRYPVAAETVEELRAKHARGERTPLASVRSDLPRSFVRIVESALSSDPAQRPATMHDFERALVRVARSGRRRGAPRWTAAAAVAAVALTLAAILVLRPGGQSPLQVESTLFRSREDSQRAIDSGADVTVGDQLYLQIEGARPMHVYVLDEDARGAMTLLFPLAGAELTNPLPAGELHRLPGPVGGQSQDWLVTSFGERETLLVVASTTPVPALEEAVANLPQARSETPLQYARFDPEALEGLRSIAGLAPNRATPSVPGSRLSALAASLRARAATDDGLWFREITLVHE